MSLYQKKIILSFSIMALLTACGTTKNQENTHPEEGTQEITPKTFNIRINEVLTSNKSIIKDPDYQNYSDYIELYNDDNTSVDISNFGLSDKLTGSIWKFPSSTTINAKGYLLIWADKKDTGLHTNFKLSSDGENVTLYDTKLNVLDKITFQTQDDDIAITKDRDNKLVFIKPTPLKENDIVANIIIDDTIQTPTSDIYISELMARNTDTAINQDFYAFSDWIELYNKSNHAIDISGYKLSDNNSQWTLPNKTVISANSHLLIWADKKDTGLHTNFSLRNKGESLAFHNKSGKLIDKVNFKKQKADISYGRDTTTHQWGYMHPSIKQLNKTTFTASTRSNKPSFSLGGGFYNQTSITMSTEDGGEIFYTTDGSTPSKSSKNYKSTISINSTQVIKAIAYKKDLLSSNITTETYFINQDSDIPVVSLSIDNDYLYDDKIGIYVEGTHEANENLTSERYCGRITGAFNFGQDWQRPVFLEYYDTDKKKAFKLGADISISGECSRISPKKSFSIELDSKYGTDNLEYQLYSQKENLSIKDFRLRAGGFGYMVTDILAASLVADGNLDIDYQAFRTAKMYVNGEYWGIYQLREKKAKNYIQSNYPNVDSDHIDIISVGKIKAGDRKDYDTLFTYILNNDLTQDSHYQKVLTKIDIDNYIDYMSFMIFSGAQDWINNNTRLWKEKKEGAKWRWILDDVDGSFISWRQNSDNFKLLQERSSKLTSALFLELSKNTNFKNRFKQRFEQLLDTIFTQENIQSHADAIINQKKPYMHLEKWGADLSKGEPTIEAFLERFNSHIENIEEFAEHRRGIVKGQLSLY